MNSPASDAEDIGNGMRRKILGYDNNLMLVKVWFEKGAVGPVHAHPHTQTAYVV
ncbi:MAG TPA: cupin domain-containing protein, partial [Hyphomonas sp.]|nr:cupin domain-containing protein [Hyphomonas sp.]